MWGIGQVIAAPVVGVLLDKFGNCFVLTFIIILNFLSFTMIIIINEVHEFNYLAYIAMFGLGFMDNSTNCFQNIVCGFQF
jgi:MFS family permease